METIRLLRKQVLSSWKAEELLDPNQRRKFSWQFAARYHNIPILVGKGDANTFYWSINNGAMKYGMPSEILGVMNTWINSKYPLYAITKSKDLSNAVVSDSLDFLKSNTKVPSGSYIIGLGDAGRKVRLFRLEQGLNKRTWVPHKPKK